MSVAAFLIPALMEVGKAAAPILKERIMQQTGQTKIDIKTAAAAQLAGKKKGPSAASRGLRKPRSKPSPSKKQSAKQGLTTGEKIMMIIGGGLVLGTVVVVSTASPRR